MAPGFMNRSARRRVAPSVFIVALAVVGGASFASNVAAQSPPAAGEGANAEVAIRRGLDFLAVDVPNWPREHQCFSCHNNGDAARALLVAGRMGRQTPDESLTSTSGWLADPARWPEITGDEPFKDEELAAIQFGAALVEAIQAGAIPDRRPLLEAARQIAAFQDEAGSWTVDGSGLGGSPVAYGQTLATALARRALVVAGEGREPNPFGERIAAADRWLRATEPAATSELAGALIGLRGATDESAVAPRERAIRLIGQAQGPSGGWGPFENYRPEAFDTGVVLVALAGETQTDQTQTDQTRGWIEAGRRYLVETQLDDGTWPPTTRPAGAESYAHRVSTTAWAVLGLVLSERLDERRSENPGGAAREP
jgi:hypothetical protein